MQPNTLYIHDRHQLVLFHERSGYCALASRDFVLTAHADEVRTGFTTSFFRQRDALLKAGVFEPRGEARVDLCAEEIAWRDAVLSTLDALVHMSDLDRYFANLQAMWRGEKQRTL